MNNMMQDFDNGSVTDLTWYRTDEGIIGGVCDGIGDSFAVDPNWLRVAFAASVVFFGFGFLIYALAWLFLPKKGEEEAVDQAKVLGVCYALSKKYNVEVSLVRMFIGFLIVNSIGLGIVLYIAAYFLMENSSWVQYLDD